MTSRERVIAAVEFTGPDRLPHRHCVLPAAFPAHPHLPRLLGEYPSDFAGEDGLPPAGPPPTYAAGRYTDEWQCEWTVIREGYMGQVTGHPLKNLHFLSQYHLPLPARADALDQARVIARNRGTRYLCLGASMTLFERMIELCGFQKLLVELGAGNPAVLELRDRIVEHNVALTRELLGLNPDAVSFADDWGTQMELMISPGMWREVFLPAYRRQFEPVRESGKHVFFHTDGRTIDILPDLVEAGVSIFWVDLTVNPLERLRSELGGRVCFQALTDVQFVLPGGTPQQVRQHGRDIIAALASFNGGLIACSEVNADQPWENLLSIFRTFHEDGRYPLALRWSGNEAVEVEVPPDRAGP